MPRSGVSLFVESEFLRVANLFSVNYVSYNESLMTRNLKKKFIKFKVQLRVIQ